MIKLETLKNDLVNNQKNYDRLVIQRNGLNVEVFRMEGAITYIKALIHALEQKALESKKEKKVEDKEKPPV